ncbi:MULTISPECIES: two-component system sensor histidine kinase NtrB [Stenotrophomonas]|nr:MULTISPECIES: ATP-binding protein [Stenotrophomonas]KQO02689.1 hypothetical protein ASF01_02985 [Stenotrophomonas sp. Leaf70]
MNQQPHYLPRHDEDSRLMQGMMQLRSCAILELDDDGLIHDGTAGVESIYGYAREELRGRSFASLFSRADQERGMHLALLARVREQGIEQSACPLVRRDGTRFRAALTMERGVFDGGAPRILMVVRDITEFFQNQKRVQEAQESAMRAQRLDAFGKLTLELAHDFNNLLSVIANSLDMLSARRAEDEGTRRLLDLAHRAVERGTGLTRQMLVFGRGQALVPQLCRVNDLLVASRDLYQRVCGEGVQVTLDLAEDLPPVAVDVGQLEAALLNLLGNSRDAIGGRGDVLLQARLEQRPVASGIGSAGYIRVTVGDSGPGIGREIRDTVFEPFFTTKPEGQGSGLGLSQVHGFVAQSGGMAEIGTSTLGGAAVSMYFPVAEGASGA